jgi:NarL family two-component system response regulator LiaR
MKAVVPIIETVSVLVVTPYGAAPEFVAELARSRRYRPAGGVVSLVEARAAARTRSPDVAVVELTSLTQLDSLVAGLVDIVPVVVVCDLPEEPALLAALARHARAFVRMPIERGLLAQAVTAAVNGWTYVDPRSTGWLVQLALQGRMARSPFGLSVRQLQVVELANGGLTNAEIAAVLGVSVETVKTHMQKARRRSDSSVRLRARSG